MKGISINLLPVESTIVQKKVERIKVIQKASVALVLVMVFLSSLVVTFRILQVKSLNNVNSQVIANENRITELRGRESTIVLLKDRLDQIDILIALPSRQKFIYEFILNKIPTNINLSAISVGVNGDLIISATSTDTDTLSEFFTKLTSDEIFNEIADVSVESLSRSRDGFYRVSLKLTAKK